MSKMINASPLNVTLNNSETKLGKFMNGNVFISTSQSNIDIDDFSLMFSYYNKTGINLLPKYKEITIALGNLSMYSYPEDVTIQSIPILKEQLTIDINRFYFVLTNDKVREILDNLDIVIDSEIRKINNNPHLKRKIKHSYSKIQKTYLMTDSNTGYTKIGRSIDPSFRETTLQSEKPTITLIATCEKDIEEKLHDLFSQSRIRGEWFDLSDGEIGYIINEHSFKKIE